MCAKAADEITVQKVVGALRGAGFTVARGHSPGYEVHRLYGVIYVWESPWTPYDLRQKSLAAYHAALTARGLEARLSDSQVVVPTKVGMALLNHPTTSKKTGQQF